jgi:hypothetical protein
MQVAHGRYEGRMGPAGQQAAQLGGGMNDLHDFRLN